MKIVTWTVVLAASFWLLARPDLALAQQAGFSQERTTAGCLFYSSGQAGWTHQWSRSCTAGQVIDGLGVLEGRLDQNGTRVRARLAGRMVGGYLHGTVDYEMAMDDGRGGGFVTVSEGQTQFNMGCNVTQSGCTPGVVAAATRPPSPATPATSAGPSSGPSPVYVFLETVACSQIPLNACDFLNPENAENIFVAARSQLAQHYCGTGNFTAARGLLDMGEALKPAECRQVLDLVPGR